MFCRQCGTKNPDDSRFCEQCGTPFAPSQVTDPADRAAAARSGDPLIGRVLDGVYRVDSVVGQGGQGIVYQGLNVRLDLPVAIKVLAPGMASDTLVSRFEAEARTQARLRHPNIVAVQDFFTGEGIHAIVMEFVEGHNLEDVIHGQTGPMPLARIKQILNPVLEAMSFAHEQGIVHRDIKPSNILLSRVGGKEVPKVMDFGIAKVMEVSGMTAATSRLGTICYMSPEQCRSSRDVDARSDVYSLGVTLFEMATGQVPFNSQSEYEVMRSHQEVPPPPARSFYPGVEPAVARICETALAKDPGDRYQSAGTMHLALANAQPGQPGPKQAARAIPRPPVVEDSPRPIMSRSLSAAPSAPNKPAAASRAVFEISPAERAHKIKYLRSVAIQNESPGRLWYAVESWIALLELAPDNQEALQRLQNLHVGMGEPKAFVETLERLCKMHPALREALTVRAAEFLCLHTRDMPQAVQKYEEALRINPNNASALAKVEEFHGEAQAWDKLVSLYDWIRIASKEPEKQVEANLKMALVLDSVLSDTDRAAKRLSDVLILEPDNQEALEALTNIHERRGTLNEFTEFLEQHARENRELRGGLLLHMATIQEAQGLTNLASQSYERAAAAGTEGMDPLLKLEELYKQQEEWEKLVGIYGKIAEQTDDHDLCLKAYENMALIRLEVLSDLEGARSCYVQVLRLDPTNEEALEGIRRCTV